MSLSYANANRGKSRCGSCSCNTLGVWETTQDTTIGTRRGIWEHRIDARKYSGEKGIKMVCRKKGRKERIQRTVLWNPGQAERTWQRVPEMEKENQSATMDAENHPTPSQKSTKNKRQEGSQESSDNERPPLASIISGEWVIRIVVVSRRDKIRRASDSSGEITS